MKRIYLFLLLLVHFAPVQAQGVLGIYVEGTPPLSLDNANIVADGDSYVHGNGYTPFSTYIMAQAPFLTNGATMQNFGVGGQTIQDMLDDQASQVLPLYNPSVANILIVGGGPGNLIYFEGDATDAFDVLKAYCQAAKASNNWYIIVTTTIPRNQSTSFGDNSAQYNAKLEALNALIVADDSFYDKLIRPELDPLFETYSSGGYDADEVHPNQDGQDRYGQLYIDKILELE